MKNIVLSAIDIHEVYVKQSEDASKENDYMALNLIVQSDEVPALEVAIQATRLRSFFNPEELSNYRLSPGCADMSRKEDFEKIFNELGDSSSELHKELSKTIESVFLKLEEAISISI